MDEALWQLNTTNLINLYLDMICNEYELAFFEQWLDEQNILGYLWVVKWHKMNNFLERSRNKPSIPISLRIYFPELNGPTKCFLNARLNFK